MLSVLLAFVLAQASAAHLDPQSFIAKECARLCGVDEPENIHVDKDKLYVAVRGKELKIFTLDGKQALGRLDLSADPFLNVLGVMNGRLIRGTASTILVHDLNKSLERKNAMATLMVGGNKTIYDVGNEIVSVGTSYPGSFSMIELATGKIRTMGSTPWYGGYTIVSSNRESYVFHKGLRKLEIWNFDNASFEPETIVMPESIRNVTTSGSSILVESMESGKTFTLDRRRQ